jgi:cytochrome c oxidase subunit 2
VNLRSEDVIHSFFVPSFRFKQDAVPGREIPTWFEVTKPGKYEIPCAELCGFGHSGMRAWIYVHTAEEYAKWAAANLGAQAPVAQTAQAEPSAAKGESDRR